MKNISQWIGVLCISCYVMGLLLNLVQLTYTQKVVQMTVALFIIVTVFKPITQPNFFSFDFSDYQYETYNSSIQDQAMRTIVTETEIEMQQKIKTILNEKNIGYENIIVHIYEENGLLNIEYIEVLGVKNEDKNSIYNALDAIVDKELINLGGIDGETN